MRPGELRQRRGSGMRSEHPREWRLASVPERELPIESDFGARMLAITLVIVTAVVLAFLLGLAIGAFLLA